MATAEECAQAILETVPEIMREIRAEFRSHRAELSVPQYRALSFVSRNEKPSLSDLADHIGLTLPSMSKLVDGLVARGLLTRVESAEDRRRLVLGLTETGQVLLAESRAHTHASLAGRIATLSPAERDQVIRSLHMTRDILTGQRDRHAVVGEA